MGYRVEYRTSHIEAPIFRQKYQDQEKFMAYCRECPRYNTRWSCPPLSFGVPKFLEPYTSVNLLCAKISLDDETIRAADTDEKIKTVGWEIVSAVKRDADERLRKLEARIPESLSLSSGGCILCENCTRKEGKPCRQPDKMRYSLDAFGFDLSAITKDIFHIEILWCKGSLPKYFTLIHALLAKQPVSEKLFEAAGLHGEDRSHSERKV